MGDEEEEEIRNIKDKSISAESLKDKSRESSSDLVNRNAEYQIRPSLPDKFKSLTVKEIIHTVLNEELGGKTYSMEESEIWAKNIVAAVKDSVKELGFKRYKLIVQTVLGQNKGSGVKIGARCLWDADTDNFASDTFLNETMFCCVVVFGIYCY